MKKILRLVTLLGLLAGSVVHADQLLNNASTAPQDCCITGGSPLDPTR